MSRHLGNLTVTKENVHDFPAVTEIYGHLTIAAGAHLTTPNLTSVRGWVTVHGTLLVPVLGTIDGWLTLPEGADFMAPFLTRVIQDLTVAKDVHFVEALEKVGALILQHDAVLRLDLLKEIYGSLSLAQNAALTTGVERVGKSITLREGSRLITPELAHIGGYYDAEPSARLVAPKFQS